jgi:glycosyltransferase involved in cell wall biosynthesis
MKVLHILQNYEPSKGGTQLLFKEVSEYLFNEFEDQILVATTNSLYDPGSPKFKKLIPNETINNIIVYRFGYRKWHRDLIKMLVKIYYILNIKNNKKLLELLRVPDSNGLSLFIKHAEVDVICASSSGYKYMDYSFERYLYKNSKPFVMMGALHFDDDNDTIIQDNVLKNIQYSDLYIANTKFEKECLENRGIKSEKIKVVGCGVHLNLFENIDKAKAKVELNISSDTIVFGYVGRFAINKDIKLLLQAFTNIKSKNIMLLLAGASNNYFKEILKLIDSKEENIRNRIRIVNDFTEELKPKLFACMDVFVSASYSESFGIVFLEAWASGIPVIGTSIGAIRSVISDNEDGLLFEKRNCFELQSCMEKYLINKELRIRHAKAGKQKVISTYTWDKVAKKYREIYIEAIKIHKSKCVDLQAL